MPTALLFEICLQTLFSAHAIQTGRGRWVYVILALPVIGFTIYFFHEVLPTLHQNEMLRLFAAIIDRITDPNKNVRQLKHNLEVSDTIFNRKELARWYIDTGHFEKAIPLLKKCLEGVYTDDLFACEGLCCAYFFNGDYENAKTSLLRLKQITGGNISDEFKLLYARTLEALGDMEKAKIEYLELTKTYSGEEARCRYALLLKRMGNRGEAKKIFKTILKESKTSPRYYTERQRQWIQIARKAFWL